MPNKQYFLTFENFEKGLIQAFFVHFEKKLRVEKNTGFHEKTQVFVNFGKNSGQKPKFSGHFT